MGVPPIRDVRYPVGTTVLWRWIERPEDHRMAAFAAAFAGARRRVQDRTRAGLDAGDVDALIGYARRCALAAARTGDPRPVVSALDALSAVDAERADSHDLAFTVLAVAAAAGRGGLRFADAAAGAARRADPRVFRMLVSVASRPANSIGYRPVEAAGGTVLVFDGGVRYSPGRDLVPIALGLAAALAEEGTYRVDAVSVRTSLPPSWIGQRLDPRVTALVDEMTGCVSLRGAPMDRPRDHMLLAFLAESATPEGATAVAERADRGSSAHATVLGVADGRLSAVLVVRCLRTGPPFESPERLARFRTMLATALRADGTLET
jgi:hypothetical protein